VRRARGEGVRNKRVKSGRRWKRQGELEEPGEGVKARKLGIEPEGKEGEEPGGEDHGR
jgi:hypothetical protein